MSINTPSPQIAAWHHRWKVIRDVVLGEYQIKAAGEDYLPRFRANQTPEEYERFKKTTPWFPATARTAQGRRGLMFAKNVVLDAHVLAPIANVLTKRGHNWRSIAEQIVYETFQTNFTGLLVDHPPRPEGVELNAQNAIMEGFRPFLNVYSAESVLEVTRGLVRNQQLFVKVRLRESDTCELELALENGIYVQRRHELGGQTTTTIPTRNGKPLTEIPFEIVSDNREDNPQPSVLEDMARLNLNHYVAQGRLNALQVFGSGLVPILKGIEPKVEIVDGKEVEIMPELNFGPGGYLLLPNPDSDFGFLEPEGKMASELRSAIEDLEDKMAKVGARMLAPEAVAPEAEITVAMRNAAEDSVTGSLAQTYAARISRALARMAWWMSPGDEAFVGDEAVMTLNTDYNMRGMSAQERAVAATEVQSGLRSWEDYFEERKTRGVVISSLTAEQERARIEQDAIDRPTTATL